MIINASGTSLNGFFSILVDGKGTTKLAQYFYIFYMRSFCLMKIRVNNHKLLQNSATYYRYHLNWNDVK